jgi:hypothetical protein
MKHIITKITLTILSSSLIIGCSSLSPSAPSQNSALNSISSSNSKSTNRYSSAKPKDGYMQKAMDNWLTNDWTPTVSKDKEIQEKYMQVEKSSQTQTKAVEKTYIRKDGATKVVYKDGSEEVHYVEKDDKPFTLQEFVDKASAYRKARPNDYEHSNVKKLESMPIIGK